MGRGADQVRLAQPPRDSLPSTSPLFQRWRPRTATKRTHWEVDCASQLFWAIMHWEPGDLTQPGATWMNSSKVKKGSGALTRCCSLRRRDVHSQTNLQHLPWHFSWFFSDMSIFPLSCYHTVISVICISSYTSKRLSITLIRHLTWNGLVSLNLVKKLKIVQVYVHIYVYV